MNTMLRHHPFFGHISFNISNYVSPCKCRETYCFSPCLCPWGLSVGQSPRKAELLAGICWMNTHLRYLPEVRRGNTRGSEGPEALT